MGHRAAVLTATAAAHAAVAGYALHVVPANGGGVDRYVRDICACRPRDCILHVVSEQCVFEAVAEHRFIAIDSERIPDSSVVKALGRPVLLHAHSALAPVRERVAQLSHALGVDYVITLHDIDFAGAFGAVEDGEREARLNFVRHAAERVVPSEFISGELSAALGSQTTRQMIENGVAMTTTLGEPAVVLGATGVFQIAVVGALGLHKGLKFLQSVVAVLPSEIRVVVIGYADGQITPGWLQPGRLWVHGAFEPRDLPTLIQGYGLRLALFPNRQPESYSYALSDAWRAGLPALGPAAGAIGERIARSGAGWTYDANSSAEAVAAVATGCLARISVVAANVHDAAARLLSTGDMVERLNQCYEKIMSTAQLHQPDTESGPQIKGLEAVAATHLNGHFFRGELIKLSGDLAFLQSQAAHADQALQTVMHDHDERGAWIAKLETSLAESRAEIARIEAARVTDRDEGAKWVAALETSLAESKAEIARIDAARVTDRDEGAKWTAILETTIAESKAEIARIEAARVADRDEAAKWIATLETSLAESKAEIARVEAARVSELAQAEIARVREHERAEEVRAHDRALADASLKHHLTLLELAREQELALQRSQAEAARVDAHAAHERYAAKLQQDVTDTLAIAHQQQRTIAIYERALFMIPSLLRRQMLVRAERLISTKAAQ